MQLLIIDLSNYLTTAIAIGLIKWCLFPQWNFSQSFNWAEYDQYLPPLENNRKFVYAWAQPKAGAGEKIQNMTSGEHSEGQMKARRCKNNVQAVFRTGRKQKATPWTFEHVTAQKRKMKLPLDGTLHLAAKMGSCFQRRIWRWHKQQEKSNAQYVIHMSAGWEAFIQLRETTFRSPHHLCMRSGEKERGTKSKMCSSRHSYQKWKSQEGKMQHLWPTWRALCKAK